MKLKTHVVALSLAILTTNAFAQANIDSESEDTFVYALQYTIFKASGDTITTAGFESIEDAVEYYKKQHRDSASKEEYLEAEKYILDAAGTKFRLDTCEATGLSIKGSRLMQDNYPQPITNKMIGDEVNRMQRQGVDCDNIEQHLKTYSPFGR